MNTAEDTGDAEDVDVTLKVHCSVSPASSVVES